MAAKFEVIADAVAKLSLAKKLLILVGTLAVISGGYYYFLFTPKQEEINRLSAELARLQIDLAKKQAIAKKLAAFKEEVAKLDEDFARMLIRLPSKKEIPSLLSSISRLGRKTGLEFLLFKPKSEVGKDFYSEIPVDIKVLGSFHKVAAFFDKVGKLPRIVNITDLSMTPSKTSGTETSSEEILLTTSCLATTFRFVERREENETKKTER